MKLSTENKRFLIFTTIGLILILSIVIPMLVNLSGYALNKKIAELREKGFAVTPEDMEKLYAPIPDNPADIFYTFDPYIKTNQKEMDQIGILASENIRNCPNELIDEVKDLLKKHEAFFKTVSDTAHEHRQIRFKRNWALGFELLLPELNIFRSLSKKAVASAYLAGLSGDRETVISEIDTITSLTRWAAEDPFMISHLVGMASAIQQLFIIENGISAGIFSDGDLKQLMQVMDEQEKVISESKSFSGEALFITSTEITIKNGPNLFGPIFLTDYMLIPLYNLFFESADKSFTIGEYYKEQKLIEHDYYTEKTQIDTIDTRFNGAPSYYLCTRRYPPAIYSYIMKKNAAVGWIRCAKTGLAIELFRRKYGKLPEKLSELVPEFLPRIPLDPFDGKELRYIKGELDFVVNDIVEKTPSSASGMPKEYETKEEIIKANGFLVYSIVVNLKDEGGKPPTSKDSYKKKYDIGFSVMSK